MRKHVEKERWAIKGSYKNGMPIGFCNETGLPSIFTTCFSFKDLAVKEMERIKKDYPLLAKRVRFKVVKVEIREVNSK